MKKVLFIKLTTSAAKVRKLSAARRQRKLQRLLLKLLQKRLLPQRLPQRLLLRRLLLLPLNNHWRGSLSIETGVSFV